MNFKQFHESKNLFDESTLLNGYYDTTSYQYYPNDNYRCFSLELTAGTYTIFAKSDVLTIRLLRVSSSSLGANAVNLDNRSYTFTLPATETIYVSLRNSTTTNDFTGLTVMLNTGSTPQPYEPYSSEVWHDIPYYQHKTATDTLSLPATLYPNDTSITVGIKGNEEHTGTPTPQNLVVISGTGERTGNLFDIASWIIDNGSTYTKDGESYTFETKQRMFSTPFYFSNTDIVVSISGIIESITAPNPRIHLLHADGTSAKSGALTPSTLKSENILCAGLKLDWSSTGGTVKISNLMLNSGSSALPYQPYGYKIPILINGNTTNIYIGGNPLRKSLDGTAYDTLDSDGTLTQRVDSDGSVLATPVVTQITMPTFTVTAGANTFDVDTTVAPSEVTATFEGWHPVSAAHERDNGAWT